MAVSVLWVLWPCMWWFGGYGERVHDGGGGLRWRGDAGGGVVCFYGYWGPKRVALHLCGRYRRLGGRVASGGGISGSGVGVDDLDSDGVGGEVGDVWVARVAGYIGCGLSAVVVVEVGWWCGWIGGGVDSSAVVQGAGEVMRVWGPWW